MIFNERAFFFYSFMLAPSPLPFLLRRARLRLANCATVKPVLGFALLAFPPSRSPSTAIALGKNNAPRSFCSASPPREGEGLWLCWCFLEEGWTQGLTSFHSVARALIGFADRRSLARLSLVVEPLSRGSNPLLHQLQKNTRKGCLFVTGGDAGIRTPGGLAPSSDFKSGALNQLCHVSVTVQNIINNFANVKNFFENFQNFFPAALAAKKRTFFLSGFENA